MIPQHSCANCNWVTPPSIVDAARETMGGKIDLDPASTIEVNKFSIRASQCFTPDDDGLTEKWKGSVFLNPPGGKTSNRSNQKIWLEKLEHEWSEGDVDEAVFCAFNLEIIRMLPDMLRFPHCIPDQRIRYWSVIDGHLREGQWQESSNRWSNSPSHATILFYLPHRIHYLERLKTFDKAFQRIGAVSFGDPSFGTSEN